MSKTKAKHVRFKTLYISKLSHTEQKREIPNFYALLVGNLDSN